MLIHNYTVKRGSTLENPPPYCHYINPHIFGKPEEKILIYFLKIMIEFLRKTV